MFHKLWLLFAQVCTVALGAIFVLAALRPEWVRLPLFEKKTAAPALPASKSTPLPTAQNQANSSNVPLTTESTVTVVSTNATFAPAVKRALPSVVSIAASRVDRRTSPFEGDPVFERLFGRRNNNQQQGQERPLGEGSGAIVSTDGLILTNFHVINGATKIEVMLSDSRVLGAKIVGTDPQSDLALLRVDAQNLPAIALGDSDALQVGDVVLAMGNPFGISNTVTMGIVSALARKYVSESDPFEAFIQTDAAINPGNSGGPLVNASGELVGINTAIFTRTGSTAGIGFSIPSNLAKSTMEQLVASGSVARGYLGVSTASLTPELAQSIAIAPDVQGALISGVVGDGPAANAGLRPRDVIVEFNGKPVRDQSEVISAIAKTKPGTSVPIKVVRRSEVLTINATLGTRKPIVPRE